MWQSKKKSESRLKGFDYQLVDSSAAKIVEAGKQEQVPEFPVLFRCQPKKKS